MMGEELNATYVSDCGLLRDRAYALIDQSTGKIASAKHPRKWGKLFDFRAAFIDPPLPGKQIPCVRITYPDGTIVSSARDNVNKLLSGVLEREVILTAKRPESPSVEEMNALDPAETITDIGAFMMKGRFSDYAAVHVLTTGTIDRLRELYPQGRFEARQFRPNIVVEPGSGEKDFVENAWVGHTLAIGDDVLLSITDPCPRCVMTTLPQGDLPKDPGILRAVAQHNRVSIPALSGEALPSVGVYAFVIRGGMIRRCDPVRIEPTDLMMGETKQENLGV
jgi:uncharacterized protein YcbX